MSVDTINLHFGINRLKIPPTVGISGCGNGDGNLGQSREGRGIWLSMRDGDDNEPACLKIIEYTRVKW